MPDRGSETQHKDPGLSNHMPDGHLRDLLARFQGGVVGFRGAC